jgi:hypothetical protein
MITAELILARLKQLEVEYALAGMRKPQGRDGFEYGFVSGRCKGLIAAYEEVEKMISEYERVETLKESKL